MTWQEYQEAVALLYEQLEGIGTVLRNQRIPDRITGQPRQIDALLKIDAKGHGVSIVVDAKFHAQPIDVKTVEEVAALAVFLCSPEASFITGAAYDIDGGVISLR